MEIQLGEFERIDDLQFKGLKLIQNSKKFCFGTDAVLLSHFASLKKGDNAVDLGTGTGIIPVLLAGRLADATIYGIEIQPEMAEMAKRSIQLNSLDDRIHIIEGDIKEAPQILGKGKFNLVVSNPPYKKAGSGIINPYDAKAIARHEILCTLEDILSAASKLLVSGGRFAMIHQTDRMMDILMGMRERRLEPKRIRLIHPHLNKAPNLVLIEAMLHGRPHLQWLPPLFIYNNEGKYTEELLEIYHMEQEEV